MREGMEMEDLIERSSRTETMQYMTPQEKVETH